MDLDPEFTKLMTELSEEMDKAEGERNVHNFALEVLANTAGFLQTQRFSAFIYPLRHLAWIMLESTPCDAVHSPLAFNQQIQVFYNSPSQEGVESLLTKGAEYGYIDLDNDAEVDADDALKFIAEMADLSAFEVALTHAALPDIEEAIKFYNLYAQAYPSAEAWMKKAKQNKNKEGKDGNA